ncbi:DUF4044 domain-containing protein [Lacticaseibacillus pantheris]|nr:DUF4044 domain-containing protein [Lacticaseibacillus pantheris]WKF84872.1 DUF4044 domain-containing protein [Lacticaseibacillus pantheris]
MSKVNVSKVKAEKEHKSAFQHVTQIFVWVMILITVLGVVFTAVAAFQ